MEAPTTVGALHRGLAHRRSTLTSILDRLIARGLIARTVGTADRRTFVITLTVRGRAVAKRVLRHLRSLEARVDRRVTESEIAACLKVLAVVEEEAARRGHARAR